MFEEKIVEAFKMILWGKTLHYYQRTVTGPLFDTLPLKSNLNTFSSLFVAQAEIETTNKIHILISFFLVSAICVRVNETIGLRQV